jgi:hypothetical protein
MGLAPLELPVRQKADVDATQNGPVKFGHELREQHFLFDPSYRNLNHGMFPGRFLPRPQPS